MFDGNEEIGRLIYPEGKTMLRPNITFAPSGTLILGLRGRGRNWVYAVDLETQKFSGLFSVNVRRMTGLAIARQMTWSDPG